MILNEMSTNAASPESERANQLQILADLVVAPKRAFDAINRRPTWILPLLAVLFFNLLTQFVVYRVIANNANFDRIAREKIEWDNKAAGRQESSTVVEQKVTALRRARDFWYIVPLIGIPIVMLSLSVLFYLALLVARAGTTFTKVFAVICWSFVIYRGIGGAIVIVTLLVRGAANFFPAPAEAWSPTSLAQLVSRASVSPDVYSAVSKIDVFLIWWLAVMAIGFSRTSKHLSIARSFILVGVCEAIYLTLNAAGWLRGVGA
jgi:hypothetical protein